jgi:hypothetical protein
VAQQLATHRAEQELIEAAEAPPTDDDEVGLPRPDPGRMPGLHTDLQLDVGGDRHARDRAAVTGSARSRKRCSERVVAGAVPRRGPEAQPLEPAGRRGAATTRRSPAVASRNSAPAGPRDITPPSGQAGRRPAAGSRGWL